MSIRYVKGRRWNVSLCVVERKDVMPPLEGFGMLPLHAEEPIRLLGISTHGSVMDIMPLLLAGQCMSYNSRKNGIAIGV